MKRILYPMPVSGIFTPPPGAVFWYEVTSAEEVEEKTYGQCFIDATVEDAADEPADAVYVAKEIGGEKVETKEAPADFKFEHHFAGWEPKQKK